MNGSHLKLIRGAKRKQPDYFDLHLEALEKAVASYSYTQGKSDIMKAVNHGVRAVVAFGCKGSNPQLMFNTCEVIMAFMGLLAPREFMQVFPVKKHTTARDGERRIIFPR